MEGCASRCSLPDLVPAAGYTVDEILPRDREAIVTGVPHLQSLFYYEHLIARVRLMGASVTREELDARVSRQNERTPWHKAGRRPLMLLTPDRYLATLVAMARGVGRGCFRASREAQPQPPTRTTPHTLPAWLPASKGGSACKASSIGSTACSPSPTRMRARLRAQGRNNISSAPRARYGGRSAGTMTPASMVLTITWIRLIVEYRSLACFSRSEGNERAKVSPLNAENG
jgi:hypothetical protein